MDVAAQWQQVELTLDGPAVPRPYVEVQAWVDFTHDDGTTVVRPVFWDGGTTYRVRFASPRSAGAWQWSLRSDPEAVDRAEVWSPSSGRIDAGPSEQSQAHPGLRHGFANLSSSTRTLVHPDGTPAFVVADTAWALPWRATVDDVGVYAADRQAKGFTATLLMTVQPDMGADGPRARATDLGFEVGFDDLPDGHLNELNVDYFQYLDQIVQILIDHGITPVLQPVFFGFGWKGLGVAGPVVPTAEYARYCRYLVARYGAQPVIYLVGADGSGVEPQIEAGGAEVHRSDAYDQPTGLHYRPHARNDAHQDADWLDFQWCQTGHEGDHVPDRVATMWTHQPARAVMNAEPTYENSGRPGKGAGWWQGHEAWSNLCAGATMGVAYGAGSLWQWRIHAEEPGHEPFFLAEHAGWREALDFSGSAIVGRVGAVLAGLSLEGAEPCWDVTLCTRGLLDPGRLFLGYAEHGGRWVFLDADGRVPSRYWLIDPVTGQVVDHGDRPRNGGVIDDPSDQPRILLCCEDAPAIAAVRG